jgi:hypothetical protein
MAGAYPQPSGPQTKSPAACGNPRLRDAAAAGNSMRMDHHVYFWLKEERKNPADRASFEQGMTSLLAIPLVRGGRWAVPANVMPRPVIDQSWDYALTMRFDSVEDQDGYQVDAAHDKFISSFEDWWASVKVMDLA